MQYAVEELGFAYEDIGLFAWSIGGFASSWAAMNYPQISAVVSTPSIYNFAWFIMTEIDESLFQILLPLTWCICIGWHLVQIQNHVCNVLLKWDITRRDHVSVVMDAGSRIVNFIRDGTVFA